MIGTESVESTAVDRCNVDVGSLDTSLNSIIGIWEPVRE